MSVFLKRRRLLQSRSRGRKALSRLGLCLSRPGRTALSAVSPPWRGGHDVRCGNRAKRADMQAFEELAARGSCPAVSAFPLKTLPATGDGEGKKRTSSLLPDGLWRPPLRTGTKERRRGTRGGSPERSPRKGKRAPMLLPPSRRAAATAFARGAFLSATGGSVSCPAPRPHGLPLASRPSSASAKTRSISRVKSSGVAKGESENAALTTNDASTT